MIYFCTAFAVGWECPERCNLFGLLGDFQRCLQCGSDKFPNKLRYFPLVNIRAAASLFPSTSSALAFSVAVSSVLRIGLASSLSSVLPIGTKAYRTGNRSGLCVRCSCQRSPGCVRRTLLPTPSTHFYLPRHCQAGSGYARTRATYLWLLKHWKQN